MKKKKVAHILISWVQAGWQKTEVSVINLMSIGQRHYRNFRLRLNFVYSCCFLKHLWLIHWDNCLHKNITWQCLWNDTEVLLCKASVLRLTPIRQLPFKYMHPEKISELVCRTESSHMQDNFWTNYTQIENYLLCCLSQKVCKWRKL